MKTEMLPEDLILNPTHECPGLCGVTNVSRTKVACRECWYVLPSDLRKPIWQAYYNDGPMSPAHRQALVNAFLWWRKQHQSSQR